MLLGRYIHLRNYLIVLTITHQELFSSLSTVASQKYHIPPEISLKRKS